MRKERKHAKENHGPHQRIGRGFVLLELFIALAVLMVLVLVSSQYSYLSLKQKQSTAERDELYKTIKLGQTIADKQNIILTLCSPVAENRLRCAETNSWDNGYVLFHDRNHDQIADRDDVIIVQHSNNSDQGSAIRIAFSFGRTLLKIHPTYRFNVSGRFEWRDPTTTKQIVFTTHGHVRLDETP